MEDLMRSARVARECSYAPYSNYHVGAAVRTPDGEIFAGCNVENAAYPEGTCAEAGAIAAMVMAGHQTIVEVLVMGPVGTPCTPCGGCRQKLREFCADEVEVHVWDPEQHLLTTTVGELMPHAFGPQNLKKQSADGGGEP